MLADTLVTDHLAPARSVPDPWRQTLGLLLTQPESFTRGAKPAQRDTGHDYFGALISIIDRPAPHLFVLSWRDATHCRYGEQEWIAAVARTAGTCAMSGRDIEPGDAIYKPRICRARPRNAGAMILSEVLLSAPVRQVD